MRGEGIHVEFLAANRPGAHHLGFLVDDLDHAGPTLRDRRGLPGGDERELRYRAPLLPRTIEDTLGLYVELIEDPDGMIMALMPWRDPPPSG